jgi:two-component system, OmpR family, sensor histidine kinase KdpD
MYMVSGSTVRHLDAPADDLVSVALSCRCAVAQLAGGTVRVLEGDRSMRAVGEPTTRLLLPLASGGTISGVLDLRDARGLTLDQVPETWQAALTFYAASACERWRQEAADEEVRRLREVGRARDIVLTSLSHDLRTPLTTIRALANQLSTHQDERSEIIEQEANRLDRLVSDLLDASRLALDGFQLRPTPAPVDDLLLVALQRVEGTIHASRIVVQLPADPPLLLARMDPVHTVRILSNLLENANKYAPGETPIEVTVSEVGAEVRISVSDRGPGIAPEESSRIFDPLYRPSGTPPDVGGSGLGLSIARGLARAQGGDVTYRDREGGGAVFELRLPAASLADLESPGSGAGEPPDERGVTNPQ